MSDTSTQQEPSMEEILSSIRRIISSDDEEGEQPAGETEAPAEETLEEAVAEPEVPDIEEIAEPVDEAVDPLADDSMFEVAQPEPEPEPEPAPMLEEDVLELTEVVSAPQPVQNVDDQLVSPPTAAASVAAFGALNVAAGGRTVEQLAAELMRPMLRDWLDKNLPDLVERLVQAEIKRLAEESRRQ